MTSVWTELAPREYGVTESPSCFDTWCHPVRVSFVLLQISPVLSLIGACGREVGRAELIADLFVLKNFTSDRLPLRKVAVPPGKSPTAQERLSDKSLEKVVSRPVSTRDAPYVNKDRQKKERQ